MELEIVMVLDVEISRVGVVGSVVDGVGVVKGTKHTTPLQ